MTDELRTRKSKSDRRYYAAHAEKVRARVAQYKAENRDRVLLAKRTQYENNREEILRRRRERYKDPQFRSRLQTKAEAYRRRVGIAKKGLSGPEEVIREVIVELYGSCRTHDKTLLVNPETGRSLELDFVVESIRLAVEVNGPHHRLPLHGIERLRRAQQSDRLKAHLCREKGLRLIIIEVEDGQHYARPGAKAQLRQAVRTMLVGFRDDLRPSECVAGQ